MKREPQYVSRAQRSRDGWAATGALLGMPGEVAREIFIRHYWTGIDARDFHALVARGEFTRENILSRAGSVESVQAEMASRAKDDTISDEEIDSGDRLNFELKGVIEIGDEWEAGESASFLSGGEYITKGRRYRITDFADRGFGDFSVLVTTNFPAPDNKHWVCAEGIRRVFRDGRLIWDWKAAWVRQWNARNPDNLYPADAETLALFSELGWPPPPVPVSPPQ